MKRDQVHELADRYLKTVRWSDEDECYVGTLHDLAGDCCHGDSPVDVYRQLENLAVECVEDALRIGHPLPAPRAVVLKEMEVA